MASDYATAAALFRRVRESRGWSWGDLARALRQVSIDLDGAAGAARTVSSIQRAIARWESPSGTFPGDKYQVLIALVYAQAEDQATDTHAGSAFDMAMTALLHAGATDSRIRELTTLATRLTARRQVSPTSLLPEHLQARTDKLGDDRIGLELIAEFAELTKAINRRIGNEPFVRLQIQLAPVVQTCRRLLNQRNAAGHPAVASLATDTFLLAARLAFETRDDETSASLYEAAETAAEQLTDRSRVAAVRTSRTMVTLHSTGDLITARDRARSATTDALRGSDHNVRARAFAVYAETCARIGDADRARQALSKARKLVSEQPQGAGGFTVDRLAGFEGVCALHYGHAQLAHDQLIGSMLALTDSRDLVQRGIVSCDLALARLKLGEPESAATLLHDAVASAAHTRGRVATIRLRHAREALRPWRTEDFVAELDDHIADNLLGR